MGRQLTASTELRRSSRPHGVRRLRERQREEEERSDKQARLVIHTHVRASPVKWVDADRSIKIGRLITRVDVRTGPKGYVIWAIDFQSNGSHAVHLGGWVGLEPRNSSDWLGLGFD